MAKKTYTALGRVQGQPLPFIKGHQRRKSPVDIVVDPVTGCHVWQQYTDPGGYGRRANRGESSNLAHRAAYEKTYGPIPEGMFVCHECDNPPCVNPEHLFLGSPADNIRDAIDKGRIVKNRRDHCPNGHAYVDSNSTVNSNGYRECLTCKRARTAAWRAARRARENQEASQCA